LFIWKLKTSSFPGTRRSRKSRATEKSCWTFLHGMAGSVDRTALPGNFSTEWPVRWTERPCQGTSPRNGRFSGQNGLVRELLHGMAGSVDRTALSGDFSTEWRFGGRNGFVWGLLHRMAGSVDGTALSGDFSTEWPVRWTERPCLGTSPRNGRFGGRNGLVWGHLHGMAGSVDGIGLVGYLRENLAPKVRLKSRGRSL